jgi:hypothetical protein
MNDRTITLQYGNATIIVHRPVLTESERLKREEQARTVLGGVMRDYYKRKESSYGR